MIKVLRLYIPFVFLIVGCGEIDKKAADQNHFNELFSELHKSVLSNNPGGMKFRSDDQFTYYILNRGLQYKKEINDIFEDMTNCYQIKHKCYFVDKQFFEEYSRSHPEIFSMMSQEASEVFLVIFNKDHLEKVLVAQESQNIDFNICRYEMLKGPLKLTNMEEILDVNVLDERVDVEVLDSYLKSVPSQTRRLYFVSSLTSKYKGEVLVKLLEKMSEEEVAFVVLKSVPPSYIEDVKRLHQIKSEIFLADKPVEEELSRLAILNFGKNIPIETELKDGRSFQYSYFRGFK